MAALVAGLDGEALRELAGLSRSSQEEDVRDLLPAMLAEAGVADLSLADAQVIVLRDMAETVLAGGVSVREMTGWAHDVFGHDGSGPAQQIVELDDELDAGRLRNIRRTIESFLAATADIPGGRTAQPSGSSAVAWVKASRAPRFAGPASGVPSLSRGCRRR